MNATQRMLTRIFVSLLIVILCQTLPLPGLGRMAGLLLAYALIGLDVLWHAARNIARGQVFDEHFLMALATLGALAIGETVEAVGVMLFYQVGELFQSVAVGRSRKAIAALMDIRPDRAAVLRDGAWHEANPEDVAVGETIRIRVGERVPLDAVVIEGSSLLDTAALTGEAVPREIAAGDEVLSGCINQRSVLTARVTKPYAESTVSKILALVENAGEKKARTERFITRFARVYTPLVVCVAVCLAVLPPLFVGDWLEWLSRALIFLMVSCPCALVISVPLAFFGGIGGASRAGVLIKSGNDLEALARVTTVAFDKTGTLSNGVFRVTNVLPTRMEADAVLALAALAECHSTHPIAYSLREAYGGPIDEARVGAVQEFAGEGLCAMVDGQAVAVGNEKLMQRFAPAQAIQSVPDSTGTVAHVAVDGQYEGAIVIEDALRPDAWAAIAALKRAGVRKTVLLTGDRMETAERVAAWLSLDETHAGLLPQDKVTHVEALLGQTGGTVAFVGDGINDAPVLMRADVGIAMGAMGSDAAIEAADVVLMTSQPSKIAEAILLARRTLRIARQNIVVALGVKGVVLILATLGLSSMWMAVFADVGVSVLAMLNAMRALRVK